MAGKDKGTVWCNRCGKEWIDTGEDVCPYCGSGDVEIDWLVLTLSYPERETDE